SPPWPAQSVRAKEAPCGQRAAGSPLAQHPADTESRSVKAITRINRIATTGFPALLLTEELITRHDLKIAEQHAAKERTDLAETIVALGIAPDAGVYRLL